MLKFIKTTWITLSLAGIALLYQNCSPSSFQINSLSSSSTGTATTETTVPPVVLIADFPKNLTNLRSFDFKFTTSTNPFASIKSVSCIFDAGPATDCLNGFSAINMVDGTHSLRVRAQDSLGNNSEENVVLWRVDGTKPEVTINQKPPAVTGSAKLTFSFASNEISNFLCALDSETLAPCTSPLSRTTTEGTHAFKIQAIDDAKNSSDVVTSSFKVDLTAPALNILTKPAVLIGTNTSSFTFNGTDDGMTISVFSCKLDNQAATVCNAGSVNYANLTEGSHTFSLSGQDSAGNLSTAVTYTWSVDLTAPTTPVVTADVPASTKNTTATFIFSATDLNGIKSFECQIDTGSFAACTSPKIYTGLALGNHTFSVRAKDQVDNLSTTSSFAWAITAPPTPTPTPTPTPSTDITALNFPSNYTLPTDSDPHIGPFVAMQFKDPEKNGLPYWGPGEAGATYIWKVKLRRQKGYYTTMWWSNDVSFVSNQNYAGGHPYPYSNGVYGGNQVTTHAWELAGLDTGADFLPTLAGTIKMVQYGQWMTQALVVGVDKNGNPKRTGRFYINLPSVNNEDIIEHVINNGYGNQNPASASITFGDSPWYGEYQHERLSGLLRGIKIFNKGLSENDIIAEATSDNIVTTTGKSNIWYMNMNPTPDDISDKSGKGHNFKWNDLNNRAKLCNSACINAAGEPAYP